MEENSQIHVKHLPLTQRVYAPGRADDWGGYSAHPEAPAGTVPWKNPYQSSQVPKPKAGDTKSRRRNWDRAQIHKSTFHHHHGRSPRKHKARPGRRPLPRALGTD